MTGEGPGGGSAPPPMRRKDRARDDAWIERFLIQARWGVLAMVRDGRPAVNANLFVFDPDARAIYTHTARTGLTPELLAEPRPVTFTAHEMGRLLPADEALEFSVEYAGVVVYGTGSTVADGEEAQRGLELLLEKYAPHLEAGRDYRPITPDELKRTAVFRISVESWTGKAKVAEPDFPGAFRVPVPPLLPEGFGP